jgi:hypothetical protein
MKMYPKHRLQLRHHIFSLLVMIATFILYCSFSTISATISGIEYTLNSVKTFVIEKSNLTDNFTAILSSDNNQQIFSDEMNRLVSEVFTHSLDLAAKTPVGIYVFDPDGTIGVGCYFQNLNEGNKLYTDCLYEDARIKYLNALECSDLPEDNIVAKKIEDAMNCSENRRAADNYYNNQDWLNAKTNYEKVVSLNNFDAHSQSRIDLCNEYVGNQPCQITGIVTDQEGKPLEGVTIKVEYIKEKKGKIEVDKKTGKPKTEYKAVGKTEADGRYSITVLNKSKYLQFSKGNFIIDKIKYKTVKAEIVSGIMNISMALDLSLDKVLDGVNEVSKSLTGEKENK